MSWSMVLQTMMRICTLLGSEAVAFDSETQKQLSDWKQSVLQRASDAYYGRMHAFQMHEFVVDIWRAEGVSDPYFKGRLKAYANNLKTSQHYSTSAEGFDELAAALGDMADRLTEPAEPRTYSSHASS